MTTLSDRRPGDGAAAGADEAGVKVALMGGAKASSPAARRASGGPSGAPLLGPPLC